MAKEQRPRLGKGLSALVGQPVQVNAPEAAATEPADSLRRIPVGSIQPNPYQPRTLIEEGSLRRLAESIQQSGLIQPIAVRRTGEHFQVVAGERRWRAAMLAGLEAVPAIVLEVGDDEAGALALVENVQREELDPVDRGLALKRLHVEFGLSHAELAERVGLERPTVSNLIRITELEEELLGLLRFGKLNMGHGRALLAVHPGQERVMLGKRAAEGGWSVRKLERATQRRPPKPGATPGSENIESLERQIGEQLGTKVKIHANEARNRGRISIDFYGIQHFEALMDRFGVRLES